MATSELSKYVGILHDGTTEGDACLTEFTAIPIECSGDVIQIPPLEIAKMMYLNHRIAEYKPEEIEKETWPEELGYLNEMKNAAKGLWVVERDVYDKVMAGFQYADISRDGEEYACNSMAKGIFAAFNLNLDLVEFEI